MRAPASCVPGSFHGRSGHSAIFLGRRVHFLPPPHFFLPRNALSQPSREESMQASTPLRTLIACAFATCLATAQLWNNYSIGVSLPIPPMGTGGAAGGCATGSPNQTEVTLNVLDAFVISSLRVQLTLTHTYVGDLTLTLRHCGTSVVLYDRTPSSPSDLSGWYGFEDASPSPFTTYVSTPGVVPNDTYQPVNPLSAFAGMSTGGAWTIAICDSGPGDGANITGFLLQVYGAQSYGGTVSPALLIPDGNGGCVAPVSRAINVPATGTVDQVSVTLGLNHPYVSDLDVTISH